MSQDADRGRDWLLFHFTSVKAIDEGTLVAAPMGQGVMRKRGEGSWEKLDAGWPADTHVNRLHFEEGEVFASTSKGLWVYRQEQWEPTPLAISCYQFRKIGRLLLAATEYGVWTNTAEDWHKSAYGGSIVYDFLYLPQFIVLALHTGIAIYDRLTDSWMDYSFGEPVTSLAVHEGRILGVTESGKLLQTNGRGGFERIRFDHLFLFSVVMQGRAVYLCSNRGLYQATRLGGQTTIRSVKLGCPVTDMDTAGDSLFVATMFEGVLEVAR
ncbi:hypothetical protein [Paenibacillus daejeonensis]|uniref:hypothetical protein n=1 Tax=Paenibacillus daejeonensis TaxID=135193 RepID=UPI0003A4FC69|nr:hypothetical protein [Paenibacillus daejeonensis]